MVLSPALALCHTLLSLCVQLLPEVQVRLLTRMLGGRAWSPSTPSPEPPGLGRGITPHSIRAKPARMLSCCSRCNAAICEQSMPVEVIWATAGAGLTTHATTISIGSAMYHRFLVLISFYPLFLLLFLARCFRLRTGCRCLRGGCEVRLVHPQRNAIR